MGDDWSLLRRLLVERHWQRYPAFRAQFEGAARHLARGTGQQRLARLTVSPRQFDRWVYGEIVSLPRDDACQVLEHLLGRPATELFTTAATSTQPQPQPQPQPRPPAAGPDKAAGQVEDLVLAAAAESREHADRLAVAGVDAVAVDRLRDQVIALAGEFALRAPGAVVPRAQHLRRLTCQLLDRTPRPAQARELYLVAGAACGLLASASFDLGYRDAAEAHADAVWTYGGLIGHAGVQAWARGMQALLANWAGRPLLAQQLSADGLRLAPRGGARVRLHAIEARAWSHLGDRARTDVAVSAGLSALGDRGRTSCTSSSAASSVSVPPGVRGASAAPTSSSATAPQPHTMPAGRWTSTTSCQPPTAHPRPRRRPTWTWPLRACCKRSWTAPRRRCARC